MDNILFGQLPYVLIITAIVGTIYRFTNNQYSWSSVSSQFLENKILFVGAFPWHLGIILLLLGHILAIFIPGTLLAWNSVPIRLYILEFTALILAFLTVVGLAAFIYRRLTDSRVRAMTSSWDVLVLIILAIQILTGIGNAVLYKWGSNWYAAAAVPWIRSVITLQPNVAFVQSLPLITKVHIFNAMIFIVLIPFSRFVHFLAFIGPIKYMFRPYQVVRWYGPRQPRTNPIRQYK